MWKQSLSFDPTAQLSSTSTQSLFQWISRFSLCIDSIHFRISSSLSSLSHRASTDSATFYPKPHKCSYPAKQVITCYTRCYCQQKPFILLYFVCLFFRIMQIWVENNLFTKSNLLSRIKTNKHGYFNFLIRVERKSWGKI